MSQHRCQAVVFRCIDFRLTPEFNQLLEQIGLPVGSYDLVSLAGGAKDLLSTNPAESELLFKQIEIAQRLHGVTEVVIVHHDNCGAYGIPDRQEEEKIQVSDLEKIHSLLNQRYPGLAVKSLIIKGTAEGDLRAEEVAFSVAA